MKTYFPSVFFYTLNGAGNNVKMNVEKCNEKSIIVCSFSFTAKWGFVSSSTRWNNYRLAVKSVSVFAFFLSHLFNAFLLFATKRKRVFTWQRFPVLLFRFVDLKIQKIFLTCCFLFFPDSWKISNNNFFFIFCFCLLYFTKNTSDIIKMRIVKSLIALMLENES